MYHLGACGDFAVEIERRKDELSSLVEGSVLIAQQKLLPVNQLINKDHVGVRGVMDAQSAEIQKAYEKSDKGRASQKAYRESDKGSAYQKAYQKAYRESDKVLQLKKEQKATAATAAKEKVLQLKKEVSDTQQLQIEPRER